MTESVPKAIAAPPSRAGQMTRAVRNVFLHNVGLKFLSLLAAFALWLFVNGGARDSESALQISLQLQNLPGHLMIVSPQISMVDVRVSGPRALLSRINPSELAIGLDLSGVRPGKAVFRVLADQLNLPRGVRIVRLTPSEVTLELARIGHRVLPVRLEVTGKPANGLRVTETRVVPDTVEVTGPMEGVDALKVVETVPIDVSDATLGLLERDVALEQPPELMSFSAFQVQAVVRVEEPEDTRIWKRLSVVVSNATGPIRLSPDVVNITVRGPRSLIESLELEHGAVYIDAAGLPPGRHTAVPTVDLPAGVELVKQEPASVAVQVLEERRKVHGR
jgi:YbbR domain-containing protein